MGPRARASDPEESRRCISPPLDVVRGDLSLSKAERPNWSPQGEMTRCVSRAARRWLGSLTNGRGGWLVRMRSQPSAGALNMLPVTAVAQESAAVERRLNEPAPAVGGDGVQHMRAAVRVDK